MSQLTHVNHETNDGVHKLGITTGSSLHKTHIKREVICCSTRCNEDKQRSEPTHVQVDFPCKLNILGIGDFKNSRM
jgi:hypothetical protein